MALNKTQHRDWQIGNTQLLTSARDRRVISYSARQTNQRNALDAAAHLQQTERSVAHHFGNRVDEIQQMTTELEHTNTMVFDETIQLEQTKDKTERCLQEKNLPHEINGQCTRWREGRVGIDMVDDEVDRELEGEDRLIIQIKIGLEKAVDDCATQLRALRASKFQLEQDLKDKRSAAEIDGSCAALENTSRAIDRYEGKAKDAPGSVVPEDWTRFSAENMDRARREVQASFALRQSVDAQICDHENQLQLQWATVDSAFNTRLAEMQDTHNQMKDSLTETESEINQQEKSLKEIEQAINDKMPPLKLTETRLYKRAARPNVELVRDKVHQALLAEAQQLDRTIEELNQDKADAESAHRALVRAENELHEDIRTKVNSINLDNQCMQRRQHYKYRLI
jgi:hypothetical protein